ncbi:hypothetical protein [Ponticoccus alexandrii]|uniref:Uncharacterized protein n=1 Tax=Ponticoccus alexandrii TaxID=1943633 RepID=A0ABX7FCA6_9RHOB|nr:hypothetical protein [Ponticoccus alexandrii]ETA53278.1 hypothetical protein P279_04205 [Rhodobacteraceae bacterium PD-2]QRF67862.1 hypothetical protein GQA70_17055 [Ponticoccus alexandrii]
MNIDHVKIYRIPALEDLNAACAPEPRLLVQADLAIRSAILAAACVFLLLQAWHYGSKLVPFGTLHVVIASAILFVTCIGTYREIYNQSNRIALNSLVYAMTVPGIIYAVTHAPLAARIAMVMGVCWLALLLGSSLRLLANPRAAIRERQLWRFASKTSRKNRLKYRDRLFASHLGLKA